VPTGSLGMERSFRGGAGDFLGNEATVYLARIAEDYLPLKRAASERLGLRGGWGANVLCGDGRVCYT
jgi:hypothetical protein